MLFPGSDTLLANDVMVVLGIQWTFKKSQAKVELKVLGSYWREWKLKEFHRVKMFVETKFFRAS